MAMKTSFEPETAGSAIADIWDRAHPGWRDWASGGNEASCPGELILPRHHDEKKEGPGIWTVEDTDERTDWLGSARAKFDSEQGLCVRRQSC